MRLMVEGLTEGGAPPGLRLLGPRGVDQRVGVFSFVHDRLAPLQLADGLERLGILGRAGLHCAPLAHRGLGTAPPGGNGAMRLSLGPFVTADDVGRALGALREVCSEEPAGTVVVTPSAGTVVGGPPRPVA